MKKKLMLLGLCMALPFLLSSLMIDKRAEKAAPKADVTEEIRLYSNGKLVGEWTGIGRGKLEGNSYMFSVSRGAFREEVRIQGDFVVERSTN